MGGPLPVSSPPGPSPGRVRAYPIFHWMESILDASTDFFVVHFRVADGPYFKARATNARIGPSSSLTAIGMVPDA